MRVHGCSPWRATGEGRAVERPRLAQWPRSILFRMERGGGGLMGFCDRVRNFSGWAGTAPGRRSRPGWRDHVKAGRTGSGGAA
ncbi:hypothetical protein [Lysobacter gummosus]|uniref:hypothetical protein n=1 Tax=Lysobacter gummosus TaxID=262324 RepID=UPI0036361B21